MQPARPQGIARRRAGATGGRWHRFKDETIVTCSELFNFGCFSSESESQHVGFVLAGKSLRRKIRKLM